MNIEVQVYGALETGQDGNTSSILGLLYHAGQWSQGINCMVTVLVYRRTGHELVTDKMLDISKF